MCKTSAPPERPPLCPRCLPAPLLPTPSSFSAGQCALGPPPRDTVRSLPPALLASQVMSESLATCRDSRVHTYPASPSTLTMLRREQVSGGFAQGHSPPQHISKMTKVLLTLELF
jgi:hypothetical protein